ncbi:MAG: phage Gp37/Gp68 family protein [Dehalococcoidia bacterium]
MAEFSKIEWTDHTFNPWTGCTNVSPGCDHCYAEAWSKRSGQVKWGNNPRKRTTEAYWRAPIIWQSRSDQFAALHGRRQRVFCASLADVFDNQAEKLWREDLFALISACRGLDWLLLTKRPQNIRKMLPADWGDEGYPNVWLGFTAEDQERYDQRWKYLADVPAAVRFVSYEPAIGPLRLNQGATEHPDWIISGGESGPGARPMDPQWARDIVADCQALGVAAFHKQWGAYGNNPLVVDEGLSIVEARALDGHGKGGGLLDGRLVRDFPSAREQVAQVA